jgi:flagellar hook-associated protein 2
MSISVGGLASGIDTNDVIQQMLKVQQKPIISLHKKEAAYQVELSTFGNLKNVLKNLETSMKSLDSTDDLTRFTARSGDTGLFTVSADKTATAGSYNITVTQMAEAHKLTSSAFAEGEAVGEGTLHLKVGDGSVTDIDVSGTDTLSDVAASINDTGAGVHAAVIFDGTDYFLTLTADDTGADNVINLTATEAGTATGDPENTDTTGLSRLVYDQGVTANMTNTQSAADAIISVDGVNDIHRAGNVIDDVLDGITLTLQSAPAAPDNVTTLSVERSTSPVTASINSFITAYNDVLDFIETHQSYDEATGEAGALLGDYTTNSIRNTLKNMVSDKLSDVGAFEQLTDMGVALNAEGRLELDALTLNNALDDNFEGVLQFFTQTTSGSEGFAVKMMDSLERVLDDKSGSLTARTAGILDSIGDIQDQVESWEARMVTWEERTRAQFNAMELLLAQYQTTGDYLSQQITGLQNFNSYVANRG